MTVVAAALAWCALVGAGSPAISIDVAVAAMFRCPNPSDPSVPLFTDRPCVDGVALSEVAPNAIAPAPLTKEERETLERIDKARPPSHRVPSDVEADDRREQRCAAAREGLEKIRATRRHGYRASASARLDASESRLRAEAAATCGTP